VFFSKKYHAKKHFYIVLILLLVGAITSAAQPMAGNYTINKNSAPSATNFISFQTFFNATAAKGINANVNVSVVSGSGPYNEQVTATAIFGVSSSATISINGNNEILRYLATINNRRHTLKFDGADYITIKNLTIEALGSNYAWGVHYTNNADNNTLDNCTIKVTNYTGIWGGIGVVIAASNTNALTAGAAAKNLTISLCTITGDSLKGAGNGIVINPQASGSIVSNITVVHSRIENFMANGIYVTNGRHINIKNNSILRPKRKFCDDTYGIRFINSNQEDTIVGNRIYNCFQSVSGTSLFKRFYGIYIENSLGEIEVANNVIYNNTNLGKWYGIFMGCSQNTKIVHNTLSNDGATVAQDEIYGFYHDNATCSNSAGSEFRNNNISITRKGNRNRYAVYQNSGAIKIDFNNHYITGTGANIGWAGGSSYKTLSRWRAAGGGGSPYGENSTDVHPNFSSISSGNLSPQAVAIDNTGFAIGLLQDIASTLRNTKTPDVGAYEFTINANVKRIEIANTNACEGDEDSVVVWVVNNSTASISNFEVGYAVNTQPEIFENILDSIAVGDSLRYVFKTPIVFDTAGNYTLYSRIKGKMQISSQIITVTSQPKGSKIIGSVGFKGIFNGGDSIDPDIIAIGDSSKYEITAPTGFFNQDYGTTWQLSTTVIEVINSSKTISTSDTIVKGASAIANAQFILTPSANLNGETIRIAFYIKNNATSCLSKIERYIEIVGKPVAAFTTNNVCEGDAVNFVNLSAGSTTALKYKWFFGDGDSSQSFQPQKNYTKAGQYKVELYVYNSDGFFDSTSTFVTVYDAPDVDFRFTNQCEGIAINFANTSTVFNGIPSFSWDFGDAQGMANTATPSYLYATNGFYTVTLIVTDSLGCASKTSKQVTFAKKPNAKFSFPAVNCNQKKVSFTNNTTTSAGVGFTWFFGDGDSTIAKHSDHTYQQEGNYIITLLAKNGFNCVDTAQKTIVLLGVPVPDFTPNSTCINEPVIFINQTKEPLNTEVEYKWTLNSTTNSTDISPVFTFNAVGNVEVLLKATAKNGCTDEIKKILNFSEKPIADFVIPQNVCATIPYTATNNTVISSGSISYVWQLGTKISTQISPKDTFNNKGLYKIQLIAATSAGCKDTVVKNLNVVVIPNSDFKVESRRTGDGVMVLTPVVENGEGNYSWIYSFGGGSATKESHEVKFLTSGMFTVKLRIVNKGCASTTSKNVNINTLSVKEIKTPHYLRVYPNPSTAVFNIALDNGEKIRGIVIYNILGQQVFSDKFKENSMVNINLNLIPAVYKLIIDTENAVYATKIQIID